MEFSLLIKMTRGMYMYLKKNCNGMSYEVREAIQDKFNIDLNGNQKLKSEKNA